MAMSRDAIYTFLRECIKRKDLEAGRLVHSCMISSGVDHVAVLGDCLIHLYTSGGSLLEANKVFCNVAKPSVYTWHAIISAHARLGASERAIDLSYKMLNGGIQPNKSISLCILKACCNIKGLEQGRLIHGQITRSRLESDVVIGTTLVDMYAKCGRLHEAHNVFDNIPNRDGVLWGALIAGHVQHGQDLSALQLFEKMEQEGIKPDKFIYSCILKACGSIGTLRQGRKMHSKFMQSELDYDVVIGSTLVGMYAKCGNLVEAREVFDAWDNRDIVLWGAMIVGYVQHGHGLLALELFGEMQQESVRPDKVIYSSILKACSSIKAIRQGRLIHEEIVSWGLELNDFVGNTLVDMYAKCGTLEEAWKVFEDLPKKKVVSWNAMIATYAQSEQGLLSIQLFMGMQRGGIEPDSASFSCTLKACSSVGALREGRLIHDQIITSGFESDRMVQNTLIDMYAKCKSLNDAHKIFDKSTNKDLVSWNAIIAGHVLQGNSCLVLELFAKMQDTDLKPDQVTFSCILKVCGNTEATKHGRHIHAQIIRSGLEKDMFIRNTLINMYSKCGSLEEAHKLFDELPTRNVVSWNAMIAGYSRQGHEFPAFELLETMQEEGTPPNIITFLCILKSCAIRGAKGRGRLVHDRIIADGLESDVVVGNTLIDMYVKCGSMQEAHCIFERLPIRDAVSCNSLIAGYTQPEHGMIALKVFNEMQQNGIQPGCIAFSCILKSCSSVGAIGQGRLIHEEIIKTGIESNVVIDSTLIDMYMKCGIVEEALKVFLESPYRDVVLWNALIAGYAQQGDCLSALDFFEKMQDEGISPDKVTFSNILSACGGEGALVHGRLIHHNIVGSEVELDVIVGNTLVDMYVKCGSLEEARKVFDQWPSRDTVLWSAMITGYVQHDCSLSALELFSNMWQDDLQLDQVIYASVLKACGSTGALEQGRLIHDEIIKSNLELDLAIGTSLIDMYAKEGSLEEAGKIFWDFPTQTIESCSALIAGYAQHGNCKLAEKCLEDMQQQGLKPDGTMYTNVLAACSHAAEVDQGYKHFKAMIKDHCIAPRIEHFNCMIDLLGRAGCLDVAEKLLQTMPIPPDIVGWMSLLNSCRTFGNIKLGRQCFEQVVKLDANIAAGYALMFDMYTDAHMREDLIEIQELRKYASAWKKPGRAWIGLKDMVHEFVLSDKIHPQNENSSAKVERLKIPMRDRGYVPQLNCL